VRGEKIPKNSERRQGFLAGSTPLDFEDLDQANTKIVSKKKKRKKKKKKEIKRKKPSSSGRVFNEFREKFKCLRVLQCAIDEEISLRLFNEQFKL